MGALVHFQVSVCPAGVGGKDLLSTAFGQVKFGYSGSRTGGMLNFR